MKVTIFANSPKSKRLKFHIPYEMKEIRDQIKALNSSWYHPKEKHWSIINTSECKKKLLAIIAGKWEKKEFEAKEKVPQKEVELSENSKEALNNLHEKLVLKSYSYSTLKTYKSFFIKFLTYFNSSMAIA